MRRRHAWEEEERDFGLQIAPLLDLLFVMLLFFMVTAGSHRAEKELPLDLSAEKKPAAGGSAAPEKTVRVEIAANGKIAVDGRQVPAEALSMRLRELHAAAGGVLVAPDARARQEHVVAALEACAAAGVARVALAEPSGV
ncbi:MAG: biopolymer transporter ExbD [Verrucomicrobium sp.]|nr:biopolymer transporter ExbD [Verrucomicrobium sp.]